MTTNNNSKKKPVDLTNELLEKLISEGDRSSRLIANEVLAQTGDLTKHLCIVADGLATLEHRMQGIEQTLRNFLEYQRESQKTMGATQTMLPTKTVPPPPAAPPRRRFGTSQSVKRCKYCEDEITWSQSTEGRWTPLNMNGSAHRCRNNGGGT